jgi:hypothetical protein
MMKVNNSIRKNIIFPIDLISRFKKENRRLGVDFSNFVRDAIDEKLKRIEKERLEKELKEGYQANADLDRATCEEFKFVDGENI